MKKNNWIYIFYVLLIILLTTYFSIKIINKNKTTISSERIIPLKEDMPQFDSNFVRPSKNPLIIQELNPNTEQLFDGFFVRLPTTVVKINSDGFRDHEYSIEKPNNTFRIIVLGDSIAFGWGLNISDTWLKQLERKLNNIDSDIHFEVLNFGVPGYNTLQEVEMFKEKGIKYKPDLIIVQFLHNDIMNGSRIQELNVIEIQKLNKSFPNLSKEQIFSYAVINASKLYEEELNNKPFEETWKIVNDSLHELINLTVKKNIHLMIIAWDIFNSSRQMDALKELVNEYNFYLMDLQDSVYPKYDYSKMILHPKDQHPSKFACNVISDELLEKMLYYNLTSTKKS